MSNNNPPPTLSSLASASTSTIAQLPPPTVTKKRKPSPTRMPSLSHDHTTDDDASGTGGHLRGGRDPKRTRVHFSCVECHRRKQKCDRQEPCGQCMVRKVPHLCRPFLNGVEDPNSASDVNLRLNNIESLLTHLVTRLPQALTGQPLQAQPQLGDPSNHSSPDVLSLTASGEEIFHPRSQPTIPSSSGMNLPHKPPPSGLFPGNMVNSRSGFGWGVREGRLISLGLEDNAELKEVLGTLKESGISKYHLEWVIAGVPGRRIADGLVELYFRDIDWTRYKMNRPSFMRRYTAFFDSIGKNPTSPKIDAETLKWLPLMFIVLAIATLSAPAELVATEDQAAWSRRFYGSARSGLEYAKALQRDNLDVLFAGLLASRYMLLTRRPAEGSTPLTTAFQLGLYRDGSILNLSDKREIEIRRRAWSMLYHLDRTISLLVGRPASISDAHTDTRIPANLDDDELEGDFDPAGHPLSKPTVYTYVILRHKLAEIMGRIAYHTFAIQLSDYQTILNLDRELLAWRESLPSFFAMKDTNKSFDKEHPYLFVQRHLLACEWYYTRITLNRPYLLRRKPQDARYAYSKNAAIESATADLLDRRDFVMEKGNLIVNSGGYRVLNSYMVLGVTIKLEPESAQADELRRLLNVVSGKAPDSFGRTSEPLVKEELAIVEFLTDKTTSIPRAAPNSNANRSDPDQTPVDLLLGLAATRSGRRAAEEEKRQLRVQQYREAQEAKLKSGQVVGTSNSPWGYVAPPMPGLEVHQPFGHGQGGIASGGGGKKVPKPLQPPASKRALPDWYSDDLFGSVEPPRQGYNSNPLGFVPSPQRQGTGQGQNQSVNRNTDTSFQGSSIESFLQSQGQLSGYRSNTQDQLQNNNTDQVHLSQREHSLSPTIRLSPYNEMGGGSNHSHSQTQALSQNQNQNQNDLEVVDQSFFTSGMNNDFMDGFDFGLGGMNANGMGMGMGLGMDELVGESDSGMGGAGFNPFALAQNQIVDEGNSSDDSQTAFLNFILAKIANSQPEVQ